MYNIAQTAVAVKAEPGSVKAKSDLAEPTTVRRNPGKSDLHEITRIDFRYVYGETRDWVWQVKKFDETWWSEKNTFPVSVEDAPLLAISDRGFVAFDIEIALAWLRAHGWTVVSWPGGHRAFKGQPRPVRSGAAIVKLRQRLERQAHAGTLPEGMNVTALDLALVM